MNEDRIERDTLIDASVERVWSLVSAPGFWVADPESVRGTTAVEGESTVVKNPNCSEAARIDTINTSMLDQRPTKSMNR